MTRLSAPAEPRTTTKAQKAWRELEKSAKGAKPSKYRNRKTEVDGIVFDSSKEAKRWRELWLLHKAGKIANLVCQVKFPLTVRYSDHQPSVKLGVYIADFEYFDHKTQRVITEDVKGFKTPLYRWKRKHVMAEYGIDLKEV